MSSTYTVGSVVTLCRRKILDEGQVDYDQPEILDLYNLTNRKIVNLVPRAYTRLDPMQMQSGVKQIAPSEAVTIFNVIRNLGLDGQTPGRAVRMTTMEMMTRYVPTFSTDAANADGSVWDWWPVPNYPEQFYVYPQSDGLGYIEVEIPQTPPDVVFDVGGAWASSTIALSDLYLDAIINGIMYMAYDDDTDIPGNTVRSQVYYQRFLQALGLNLGAGQEGGQ